MNRPFLLSIVLSICLFPGVLRAEPPRERAVFALIVGNNRSFELGRPDLRYADDDAVKYRELFRMLAPDENVKLLTELDRDSERLYPDAGAIALPPQKKALLDAASALEVRVREVAARGMATHFYFVYAGHGDVDKGRGFLDLADGAFSSSDLEALLRRIPASQSHVILDSCNSFFVVNPRKPGGTHFATPEDAARSLAERLPNVGVFLSTSAEAEVYEWSELGAGIFSHAVRSGLSGAADANRDGEVTYDELRAFVDVASSRVDNPLFRPQVYARGPGGRGSDAIVDLQRARAVRVRIEARDPARLTVRDAREIPIADAYKEEGVAMDLYVPEPLAKGAAVDERAAGERGAPVRKRYALEGAPAENTLAFAALASRDVPLDARGPHELFRMLFAAPFGPRAFAQYEADRAKTGEVVYGVSRDDVERTTIALENVASMEKNGRIGAGVMLLGLGALMAGTGITMITDPSLLPENSDVRRILGYTLTGGGALAFGGGVFALATRSKAERLLDDYRARLARGPTEHASAVADAARGLQLEAEEYRKARRLIRIAAALGVGTAVSAMLLNEVSPQLSDGRAPRRLLFGSMAVLDAVVFGVFAAGPSSVERAVETYTKDPSIQRGLRPDVQISSHGASLTLRGTF